ncbi:DNA-directed RNA polymerase subunit K [Candidatus Pacearchaeota archaeon]|nr:DNA-directed RNA polymerase subunit K [Candidatus Pacearchaeota archaeon]
MMSKFEDKFTKYEVARILGARSLQLAMDAPILLKLSKEQMDEINYNTLKIAEMELESEVLPITVKRPLPKKSGKTIKKLSEEEIKEKLEKQMQEEKKVEKVADKEIGGEEEKEEKDIEEEGEIMELATPEDEEVVDEVEEEI